MWVLQLLGKERVETLQITFHRKFNPAFSQPLYQVDDDGNFVIIHIYLLPRMESLVMYSFENSQIRWLHLNLTYLATQAHNPSVRGADWAELSDERGKLSYKSDCKRRRRLVWSEICILYLDFSDPV